MMTATFFCLGTFSLIVTFHSLAWTIIFVRSPKSPTELKFVAVCFSAVACTFSMSTTGDIFYRFWQEASGNLIFGSVWLASGLIIASLPHVSQSDPLDPEPEIDWRRLFYNICLSLLGPLVVLHLIYKRWVPTRY